MLVGTQRAIHFLLAISSALFLFLASITGAYLGGVAFYNRFQSTSFNELETVSLEETISNVKAHFTETYGIKKTPSDQIIVQGVYQDEFDDFYVNPFSGKPIEKVKNPSAFYDAVLALHRSLFLKKTGRFIVGFVSLLLVLLAFTGFLLVLKRRGGFFSLFKPITENNRHRKAHIILGQWMFLPVVLLGLTGVYLSAERFIAPSLLDDKSTAFVGQKIDLSSVPLSDLVQLDFPFGDDPTGEFRLKEKQRTVVFQQGDGTLVAYKTSRLAMRLKAFSFFLHTGQGNAGIAFLLVITVLAIVYFIFSGLKVASKTNWLLLKPKWSAKKKQPILLLYGSETGTTLGFAKRFKKRVKSELGISLAIARLNDFKSYPELQKTIILTSTYGEGEPPSNARLFLKKMATFESNHTIEFSVLGLGSKSYPKFCQFAKDIQFTLDAHPQFKEIAPLYLINNQSEKAFEDWMQRLIALLKE